VLEGLKPLGGFWQNQPQTFERGFQRIKTLLLYHQVMQYRGGPQINLHQQKLYLAF